MLTPVLTPCSLCFDPCTVLTTVLRPYPGVRHVVGVAAEQAGPAAGQPAAGPRRGPAGRGGAAAARPSGHHPHAHLHEQRHGA